MCGRVNSTSTLEDLRKQFGATGNVALPHRYNLPPSLDLPVVVQQEGTRLVKSMHWGLVPHWAKDKAIGNRMINARAETVAEKPAFRQPLSKRRCIIPVNGYFEWAQDTKQPFYFTAREDSQLLAFAGLWEVWRDDNGELESCTIITVAANDMMRPIHHRMPCSLEAEAVASWLDMATPVKDAVQLLQPADETALTYWPVSRAVNNPRNDTPDLLKKAA